jgi:hypothetical protein
MLVALVGSGLTVIFRRSFKDKNTPPMYPQTRITQDRGGQAWGGRNHTNASRQDESPNNHAVWYKQKGMKI